MGYLHIPLEHVVVLWVRLPDVSNLLVVRAWGPAEPPLIAQEYIRSLNAIPRFARFHRGLSSSVLIKRHVLFDLSVDP